MAQNQLLSTGGVAEVLGLPRWKLLYLLDRGTVPGPSFRIACRRLFTGEDIAQIRVALAAATTLSLSKPLSANC